MLSNFSPTTLRPQRCRYQQIIAMVEDASVFCYKWLFSQQRLQTEFLLLCWSALSARSVQPANEEAGINLALKYSGVFIFSVLLVNLRGK